MEKMLMVQEIQMTQVIIMISNKAKYLQALLLSTLIFFSGCEEVSPYSYNCKNFNEEYLAKLSKNNDIDSVRELVSLYAECNPDNEKRYNDLALQWSERLMHFKGANENDLTLYRILRNLDVDTGEPENSR